MREDKRSHRAAYERNRKRVLALERTCGICGKPVDMSLGGYNPMAPCVDHIIPVSKGGHPSDIDNLQLAHWSCNRTKSDKLFKLKEIKRKKVINNRNLPQSIDWSSYKST